MYVEWGGGESIGPSGLCACVRVLRLSLVPILHQTGTGRARRPPATSVAVDRDRRDGAPRSAIEWVGGQVGRMLLLCARVCTYGRPVPFASSKLGRLVRRMGQDGCRVCEPSSRRLSRPKQGCGRRRPSSRSIDQDRTRRVRAVSIHRSIEIEWAVRCLL